MPKPYTYTKSSTVQHVFRNIDRTGVFRLRSIDQVGITKNAKDPLGLYSDCSVKNGIKSVINLMPRKGDNKGDLKKITINTGIVGENPSRCIYSRIKMSPIKRDLLRDRGKKLRLSNAAKCPLAKKLEKFILSDLGDLKRRMPRKTRGPDRGNLKRKRLRSEDFSDFDFDTCKWE